MKYPWNVSTTEALRFNSFDRWDSQNGIVIQFPDCDDLHDKDPIYCAEAVPVYYTAYFDLKLILYANKLAGCTATGGA